MIFVYSFTIEGYDLTVTIEYLTAGGLFCSVSLYRWDTLLLKYFTDGLFLYCSMLFIVLTCLL